jgi:hypothetical protein
LLFVVDACGRRWTLYSPDPGTPRCSPWPAAGGTLHLDRDVLAAKFPGWNARRRL